MGFRQSFIGKGSEADEKLRVLIFGAHPDDADFTAGGVAALYVRQGHQVKAVSITNGDTGHHEMGGVPLARRRRAEAAAAGACLGMEYITLDNHDGRLQVTLDVRDQLVRIIRQFEPHLIITNRPYDYHPDHRAASQLVQDATCMATVPNVVSDVPYLVFTPALVFVWDHFLKPYPFIPDVVVGIDDAVEDKLNALNCHTSQVYEFLPYIKHCLDEVPDSEHERLAWLRSTMTPRLHEIAGAYRDRLVELYGKEKGQKIQYAEAFEKCEYGAPITDENMTSLFPFFA